MAPMTALLVREGDKETQEQVKRETREAVEKQ